MTEISSAQDGSHTLLLNTRDMPGMAKELNFKFYLILINFNRPMWLMATILDCKGLASLSLCKHLSAYNLPSIRLCGEGGSSPCLCHQEINMKKSQVNIG